MLATVLDSPGLDATTVIPPFLLRDYGYLGRVVPTEQWRTETSIGSLTLRVPQPQVGTQLSAAAVPQVEQVIAIRPIETVLAELYKYVSLLDGWDGYEGKAPRIRAITDAEVFVRHLSDDVPAPYTMPMPDGEVGLYWKNRDEYTEVTFSGNGQATIYVRRSPRSILADVALEKAREIEQLLRLVS